MFSLGIQSYQGYACNLDTSFTQQVACNPDCSTNLNVFVSSWPSLLIPVSFNPHSSFSLSAFLSCSLCSPSQLMLLSPWLMPSCQRVSFRCQKMRPKQHLRMMTSNWRYPKQGHQRLFCPLPCYHTTTVTHTSNSSVFKCQALHSERSSDYHYKHFNQRYGKPVAVISCWHIPEW